MVGFVLQQIISIAGDLYKLALIAFAVITLLRVPANRWTEMLRRIVEPVLSIVRVMLHRLLPAQWTRSFDWSLVALYLLITLAQRLLIMIVGILL